MWKTRCFNNFHMQKFDGARCIRGRRRGKGGKEAWLARRKHAETCRNSAFRCNFRAIALPGRGCGCGRGFRVWLWDLMRARGKGEWTGLFFGLILVSLSVLATTTRASLSLHLPAPLPASLPADCRLSLFVLPAPAYLWSIKTVSKNNNNSNNHVENPLGGNYGRLTVRARRWQRKFSWTRRTNIEKINKPHPKRPKQG